MLSNQDIFLEFYNCVKNSHDVKEVIKEYGGANIYIPSYKNTHRDDDLLNKYKALRLNGYSKAQAVRELVRDFSLSQVRIYEILATKSEQPSLF